MKQNDRSLPRFTDFLYSELRDPKFAIKFLNSVLEDGSFEAFLLALKDVIQVHGSIKSFAEEAEISRTTLYKMFSAKPNPELRTILTVLNTMGYDLRVTQAKNK